MENMDFAQRKEDLKQRAFGRWKGILSTLGIPEELLAGKNRSCPGCGGTDRFQFTDKFRNGDYHCRGCGHGDGFNLLMHWHQWDFMTAFLEVEKIAGCVERLSNNGSGEPSNARMKALARRIWAEALPIQSGDEVDRYLRNRGLCLDVFPKALRFHPALGYFEKDATGKSRKLRDCPAMLACIQGPDGQAITLHRTYLEAGHKANFGRNAKKVLSAGICGAAVRLFPATEELALAEGIETALAVHLATGKPVWAALSAGNLERVWIPDTVRCVYIYADNDSASEYDGQASAYILARRLMKEESRRVRRHVEVFVPRNAGNDWADVWLMRAPQSRAAA